MISGLPIGFQRLISLTVANDPTWTDAQATAAGWQPDNAVFTGVDPSVSFAQTMSSVYTAEVCLSGVGAVEAAIDNFALRAAVPEPATMLLLGSGLFGLAAIRKKFSQ